MRNDLVVIVPIHEYNKEIKELLDKAIDSVPSDIEIRFSCKYSLGTLLNNDYEKHGNITIYEDENENSVGNFATLVNQAVGDSEWFTILEFDDVYNPIWFENFDKYVKFKPNVSVFMPLTEIYDFNTNKFISYGNDAAWASSFSNEIGYIDNECLQSYYDFYLTGSFFNTKDWLECGGLKPSIKVTFWYEFLLRITSKGKEVFVIPRCGYKHFVNRKDSLFVKYREEISEKEGNWWFSLAKQEYHFLKDRNKVYSESENETEKEEDEGDE